MAQPHDIEDVLSSIRRLVANDSYEIGARNGRTIDAEPEARMAQTDAPALVLAPTQRVIDPDDPFQMIRSLAQEERDGRDAEFVLDHLEDGVAAITDDIVSEEVAAALWPDPDGEDVDTDVPEDYREDTDYQEEAVEDTEENASSAEPETAGDAAEDEPEDDAGSVSFSHSASSDAVAGPEATEDGALTEMDMPGDDEPDDLTFDDDAVDLADLADGVSTDDALRDLIAEIVRQELSGALGERITRNVRKLVRRELRQMLSSGEFD